MKVKASFVQNLPIQHNGDVVPMDCAVEGSAEQTHLLAETSTCVQPVSEGCVDSAVKSADKDITVGNPSVTGNEGIITKGNVNDISVSEVSAPDNNVVAVLSKEGSVPKSDVARSAVISYAAAVAAPVPGVSRASYSAVARSDVTEGQANMTPSGSSFKRRNVVQLRWIGEGPPPNRRDVVDRILGMGFKAEEIFALISPVGSYEYDLSFVKAEGLDVFWERYEQKCKKSPRWAGFSPKVVSRQPLYKNVTILVRNESIPAADLGVWLGRYADVQAPLRKVVDDRGIWTGGWTVLVKLHVTGNVVKHIPSSAFIGRDRIITFYAGQPKLCHRCGEKGHFSSSCTMQKCSLCQGLDHVAKDCNNIRCNLCNKLGHPYSLCPEALHNQPGLVEELLRMEEEERGGKQGVGGAVSASPEGSPQVSVSQSEGVTPPVSAPQSVLPTVSVSTVVCSSPVFQIPSVPNVSKSSRLAEAAKGADSCPSEVAASPGPSLEKRKTSSGGSKGKKGEVATANDIDEAFKGNVLGEEGEWTKVSRRRNKVVLTSASSASSLEVDDLPLGNKFGSLSDGEEESSNSVSQMEEDEGECSLKRPGSPVKEEGAQAKKRLPQSS